MASRNDLARQQVAQAYIPSARAPTSTRSPLDIPLFKIPMFLFYGGIVILIAVLFAYVFKFSNIGTYTIDWNTGGITKIIVDRQYNTPILYTTSPIPATVSTNFPSVLQYGYTVGFDVNITNPTPVQNMYRVFFYNGAQRNDPTVASTDPSQVNNVGTPLSFITTREDSGSSTSVSGTDATSLSSIQTALNATFSNLCMYMAQDTNDLYITYYVGHIQTNNAGSTTESLNGWNTSKPITNVPVNTPFRVTLAVDGQFIETYINGELVLVTKTIIYGNTSHLHAYNSSYNYNFYGPPDSIYYSGTKIANIQYWNKIIPPAAIRLFSTVPSITPFSS